MTVDLFAASFICRDAELGSVLELGRPIFEADRALPLPSRIVRALLRAVQGWFGPSRPPRPVERIAEIA